MLPQSWPRRLAFMACPAVVFIGVFMSAISTRADEVTMLKPIRWLLNGPGVAAIAADGEASALLDNTWPFVKMGRNGAAIPRRWQAIPFASFTSFLGIESALKVGTLAHDAEGILYDNENWQFTPAEEQQKSGALRKIGCRSCACAWLIVPDGARGRSRYLLAPENRTTQYDAYLRLGIAADAARYAYVVDIQAQGSERDTTFMRTSSGRPQRRRDGEIRTRWLLGLVLILAGTSTFGFACRACTAPCPTKSA